MRTRLDRRIARFLGNLSGLSLGQKIDYLWTKLFTRTLRRIYSLAVALGFRSVPSFMKSTDDITWVAAMNYQPRPWSGQVTLFRTTIQPDPRLPMDLGWTPLARAVSRCMNFPAITTWYFWSRTFRFWRRNCGPAWIIPIDRGSRVSEPAACAD